MPCLDHTALVNSCRDERSLGRHALRAYAQDLRTSEHYTKEHYLVDPLSRDDILAYHRHLRDVTGSWALNYMLRFVHENSLLT